MVTAWEVRAPSPKALLVAAASVPPLAAGLLLLVATRDGSPVSLRELAGFALLLGAYALAFRWSGLDRQILGRDLLPFVVRIAQASVAGFAIAAVLFLLLPQLSLGLGGAAMVGGASAVLLFAVRALLRRLVEPRTIDDAVLVVGRRDLAAKLCLDLLGRQQLQRLVGAVDLYDTGDAGAAVEPARLRELVRTERISRIIVAEPDGETRRELAPALLECRLLGVEVEDATEFYQRLHGKLWLEAIDPERLAFGNGFRITPAYLFVKRALDLLVAVVLAVVAAPIAALVALAIRLDSPGPVLFRQERVGQFGKTFRLYKFRSMRVDAESATGPVWARENDDRVTRLGRFLRRSHLDEIPQVLNVLKGDLSFVGPRPERLCFVELLRAKIPYYDLRHFVKPGVTGWAQVCAPYASSVEDSYEKLQFDLAYAKSLSLGLDLAILFRTAVHVLGARGR